MVYRQCECSGPCSHWTIDIRHRGKKTKGTAAKFGHLLVGHQKLPRTKQEARDFEAQVKAWVVAGKPLPTVVSSDDTATLLVRDVIAAYRDKQLSKTDDKAAPSIIKYLDLELGARPMSDLLNPDVLEDYKEACIEEDELSEVTANRYLTYISILINFAVGKGKGQHKLWDFAGDSPFFHQIRNPYGVKKFDEGGRSFRLDPGDEAVILAGIDRFLGDGGRVTDGEQMRGRFYCAIECGLRRGEMLLVKRDDIKWHHKDGIMIHVQWGNAKSRKERYVPVVSERLIDFLKVRKNALHPFGAENGSYQADFRRQWLSCLQLTENERLIENLRWHDLRHECGSRWAEGWNGHAPVPLHEVQLLLGHAKLTTTQKYLNAKLTGLAKSMQRAMEPELVGV